MVTLAERENYFLLLGLSFDPIEDDPKVIEAAIKEKTIQWQKEAKNPRKQAAVKTKLANVPEMRKTLLDPELRKKEAERALTIKASKIRDVKNELAIMQLKGYITPSEIENIISRHSKDGITEENLLEIISVPIESAPIIELDEKAIVIDQNAISQIETYFDNLGVDNYSICDYLNTDEKNVMSECNKRLKVLLEKGDKANSDEVEQKLLGLFVMIFKNPQLIEGYNNFLSGCQYKKINDLIKIGVNTGFGQDVVNMLIKICKEDFSINEKYAMVYIINNIRINKYKVDIEEIKKATKNNTQQIQPIAPQKTKEEEKAEIRERILEEQRIKQELEEEKRQKEEQERIKREQQQEKETKAKKVLTRIIGEIGTTNEKQMEQIREITGNMMEHKQKREDNFLVPRKGILIAHIVCFAFALCFFVYAFIASEINKTNSNSNIVFYVSVAAVVVSFFISLFYFYIYKKWDDTVKQIEKTLEIREEYKKTTKKISQIEDHHMFFTNDAREELIDYENSRNELYQDIIDGYNDFVKLNNKAKYSREIGKFIIASLICAVAGIAVNILLNSGLIK